MSTAIEDLLTNCETCNVTGMVDGERCPDCDGRGLVRKAFVDTETTDISKLKKAELIDLAEARGIDSSGTKDEILARFEAAEA